MPTPIKTLFANDIHRRIEEVIKVDQTDEEIIRDEINEYVVTDAIRAHYTGIRSGNQTLTEIMYGLFLQSLGYAKDLDLSELEIGLEEKEQLARFEEEYKRLFKKNWAT